MRCELVSFIAIAVLSLGSELPPRHYTHEEWRAITAQFNERWRPAYPAEARARRAIGGGMFRMYFDKSGKVTVVKILKSTGHSDLDASAIHALMRWRAKPGRKWELDVPITFAMTRH